MPTTRHKQGGNDTECRKTGCCGSCCGGGGGGGGGCTAKSSHTKANGRRQIREISSPLRPEQLSYVLSRNKQFDEHAIPSAWIAPFPSKNATDKSFKVDSFHADPLQQRISPSLIPTVPTNVQSSAPASFLDDRQDEKEDRQRQQWQHRLHDDQSRTSLVCSLSAELASVGRHRFRLTYITDRLLVVSYPPNATKTDHNEGARWLCKAFEKRYGDNYRIFNLSGFTKELHFSSRTPVIDLFWGGSLAPALEQLVTAIDQLDFWLHNHDVGGSTTTTSDGKRTKEASTVNNRVAVLHCTGPKSLLATYLAVYICQSKARFGPLCGQRPGSPTARGLQWNENRFRRFKNELVLGHTILKKFYEDNLARELNPSQKRYVGYFSGLLTGALILQDRLVYLHAIVYRDSSRGRYLGQPLEAIAENNENSLYAQPEDILARMQHATDISRGNYLPDNQEEDIFVEEEDWTGRWDQVFSPPEGTATAGFLTPAVRQHTGGYQQQQPTVGQISAFGPFQTFVDSECGLFLKIYQNLNLMHTTRVLCPNVNLRVERYIFPIEPVLPLHGDVLIACYIQPNFSAQFQELLFRAQFHTCAVDAEKLCFFKADLDEACEKALFPSTGCVELYFTSHRELLTEHTDNIERGCYIWTTAERESSILIDHHQHQRQRHPRQHRQHQQQFEVLHVGDKRFHLHDEEELDITVPLTSPLAPGAAAPPLTTTTIATQFQEYYNGIQHRYKKDLSTTQLPHPSIFLSSSSAPDGASSRQALRILITTQEQLISVASGLFTGHIHDTQPSMWPSNHTQEISDSSRPPRSTLMRQISDPLSHPVIRGRSSQSSSQWVNVQDASPHAATNQIPLYQQALLSPRVQVVPQKSSMQSEYPNTLTDQQQQQQQQQQSQLATNQSAGQVTVNRTNLAQLQSLYQQLLQQHQQLLQQQQQQQQQQQRQHQPNLDYPAGQLTDSNLYATVQRPPTTIPSSLVAGLQRVILQQQQQQQQQLHIPQTQPSMLPGVVYPQLSTIQPQPLTTLSLSGLSSTSAFSNLARALLPTSVAYNASGDPLTGLSGAPLLTAPPSLMPSSSLLPGLRPPLFAQPQQQQQQPPVHLQQNLPIPPTDHSYLAQQTRLGGPTNAGLVGDLTQPEMLNDPAWNAEQRRRIDLQRTRFLLNEQERKLFEELKNIRNRRAGLSRLEQLGRLGASTSSNVTPLESYRRATGRISTSEDARFRSRNRPLYAIGRSGSADAARVPLGSGGYYGYGDAYGSDLDEDSALLAILEQRLSRKPPESRRIYSDSEMGLQEAGDIPLRIVGQQQRSGHVVDGSSQAFAGSLLPGEQNEDMDLFSRRPRIQVVRSPVEASGRLPTFGASSSSTTRGRTFSGSPVIHPSQGQAYPKSKPPYTSPTKRSHFWGHSSYDEQWSRPPVADGPTIDRSSCTSPVQTHSGRLLRSPVSPPPRGYIRRPSELLDVGSQSDTGIIGGFGSRVYPGTSYPAHDYPNRRQYRGARGKTAVSAKRGQASQMPLYRSPEVNKSHRQKHPVSTGLEHVPDNVFMVLSKISASAHIWYRPEMSRNDAMDLVRAEAPGTFVVRNSGSFPHSFGLVVKVDRHHTHGTEDESDSIRHYLIEGLQSTASGLHHAVGVSGVILPPSNIPMDQSALSVTHEAVRLRGSSNEPVFTNLVSLLYEHIIQPLALPCVLRLPFKSPAPINSLPSLITLTKNMDRISPVQVAPKYTSQVGAYHPARDSPHGGVLLRHPSDPLPADSGSYEMESYYPPPPHHHHQQQQQQPGMPPLPSSMHHSARQDGLLIVPPSGSSSKVRQSRSPPAVYEGEMGPILPPDTGKTFTSIYLGSIDTENLTGSSAIRKAVDVLLENAAQVKQTEVTIRVSHEGLTVTDNWRKLFFRRNYPFHSVSFCAIDPCQRCIFGFVARKQNTRENMCHVLCDTPEYNANIITDYIMHRLNEY
ncbi:unnamed protein product [Trichobilharzia szidati]|nr:unnamed protein product [Trichobilharzia szidati]